MRALGRGLRYLLASVLLMEAMALVMAPGNVVANHSHFFSDDSVRNGHIYYDDDMAVYNSALRYADDQWSAAGRIVIRRTPRRESPTLRAITYSVSDGYCGGWQPVSGPDGLQANRLYIDNGSCGNHAQSSPRVSVLWPPRSWLWSLC